MKSKLLPASPDIGLLIIRLGISLLMMTHGFGKMEKLFAAGEIEFYNFMGLGPKISLLLTVIGEFAAPVFISLGLFTRMAAFLSAFTMGVAAFIVHAGDPLSDQEASMMYFFCFAAVFFAGPGRFSIDHWRGKRA